MNEPEFEQPPDLDIEDEAILRRIWDEIARERPVSPPPVPGMRPLPPEKTFPERRVPPWRR